MKSLKDCLKEAEKKKRAIGHFNVSDNYTLKAVFDAAKKLSDYAGWKIPIIIGVSEGERDILGTAIVSTTVHKLRTDFDYPIFINADHTHSLARVKEAVAAGFDAILFDAGRLPLKENIAATQEVVRFAKLRDSKILIEGELGYIGSASAVFDEIPKGAEIDVSTITKAEDAKNFVRKTGVDLLAPAVGNVHGMFKNAPNPNLHIERVREIRRAVNTPLVLHGGSGIRNADFIAAISHGVRIVHVSTELRRAWRDGLEKSFKKDKDEVAPYRLMSESIGQMQKIVEERLKLLNLV
ncbi:MAG: tagatose-bisphosphate aldolase [Candidatus Harrisonbacteria bacterium CG10_big_fil_rev_8_21_14_0_10_44_23]|uniref:Tagatose-bisphosphate aldolase n=1 Tax=Candidatus Harrisonbacteria bacterium CG10_big_fil_rev_8_21_14_0_10_44_23 TaxID=1974585 RepID=A0A2H0UQT3_9BACT|nr:MAG: tagatose-bisphosphate aldolase [Candidatus Harrisonbacteria bacterium CG10_big_fil_rev_8_21_14_0_10_44_23]